VGRPAIGGMEDKLYIFSSVCRGLPPKSARTPAYKLADYVQRSPVT
jgi:hypothetical protein